MNKIEKLIAIGKDIENLNGSEQIGIHLSFAKDDNWELKNETPDTMCVLIQVHDGLDKNGFYYETYYDFETLQEVMTEGDDLDVSIDLDNFKETCLKWINNAREEMKLTA
jgi:hypothetical protein